MKKSIAVLFLAFLLVSLCPNGLAQADAGVKRFNLAFGLFSVEVPADAVIGPNTGNELSALRYDVSIFSWPVYANFSPKAQYDDTAGRKLGAYQSFLYTLCGEEYTQTEIAEETLPNGIDLRWQLMRGKEGHALWFEAFSAEFGYNMCLYGKPDEEEEQRMLALMRSFQADPGREQDLLQTRQEKREDGSFISVEHGLCIRLDTGWNAAQMGYILIPGTSFALEKDNGAWLIQLMHTNPVSQEDTRNLLNWFVKNVRQTYPSGTSQVFGEPHSIALEGLGGVEAWIMGEEISSGGGPEVVVKNIAFVHESYGYYGCFMWLKQLDDVARPLMEEAIRSIAIPAE